MESGEYCLATFIDLSKAFDCVSHELLVQKLSLYNFDKNSQLLIRSYLENRRQYVVSDEGRSDTVTMTCGVPQGSILGPLLFLIFVNDFSDFIQTDTILYADDTTIITHAPSLSATKMLNEHHFQMSQEWFYTNMLTLNQDKTESMLFTTRKHDFENSVSVKFLGLHLDPKLNWDIHVESLSSTLCKNIFVMRNIINSVSKTVVRMAYFALFESHLTYGLLCWGHSTSACRIFSLQRRMIRLMASIPYRSDCRTEFVKFQIMTLPALYIYRTLLNARSNIDNLNTYRSIHDHNTRRKDDLYPNYLRLNKSRNATNYYGIVFMNRLPTEVRNLNEIKFKVWVKEFLTNNPVYSLDEFIEKHIL